jgi:hypothetical protein
MSIVEYVKLLVGCERGVKDFNQKSSMKQITWDGRIMLKSVLKKLGVKMLTEFHRRGSSGGLF